MVLLSSCFNVYLVVLQIYILLYFLFFPAVTVSLQQPMYIVDESIGAVSICAVLIGQTEKVVTLTLSPIESTALGNALDS